MGIKDPMHGHSTSEVADKMLYHGTALNESEDFSVEEINIDRGNAKTDFGRGFYLTTNKELAEKRALSRKQVLMEQGILKYGSRLSIPNKEIPKDVVKVYTIKKDLLSELSVYCFRGYEEDWLNFIAHKKLLFTKRIRDEDFASNLASKTFDVIYGPLIDGKPKLKALAQQYLEKYPKYTKKSFLEDVSKGFNFPEQDQVSMHTSKAIVMLVEQK